MKVIHGALSLKKPLEASVVTVGTFDGVHCGHQALIRRACNYAQSHKLPVVAYTFDPHPARFLTGRGPRTLMPLDRRIDALIEAGADTVLVETFNADFAAVSAEDWGTRYLVQALEPAHVVIGFNFSYGQGRGGSPETLLEQGRRLGFSVDVVEPVSIGSKVASSTEVRKALSEGRIHEVTELLGRPFAVVGHVTTGQQLGRKLGFPTANVLAEHEQVPATGVYVGWLQKLDGAQKVERWPVVVNIGNRPTFRGEGLTVEAHILDAQVDLYGARVAVEFLSRLRDEQTFDGPDSLRAQIAQDVSAARKELKLL